MRTIKLFELDHPKHGMYYVFYNEEHRTFGISRTEYNGEDVYGALMRHSQPFLKQKDFNQTVGLI